MTVHDGAFTGDVRAMVRVRARGVCERCGRGGSWFEFHHRLPRGMGGTSLAWVGSASNCLMLCRDCHRWVERHREASVASGWLVEDGARPVEVPVVVESGQVVRLTDSGTYERVVPTVAVPTRAGMVATSW